MDDRHHTQLFWFLGVLVALGVENAATPVVEHLLASSGAWPKVLEALRLVVFLVVSVRFLLRAAVHLDEIRAERNDAKYGVDLVFAFFHFLLLFGWALTVETDGGATDRWISPFLALMLAVIGYDLVWWLLCLGKITLKAKGWTALNGVTLGLCALVFFAAKTFHGNQHWEEIPSILIVLAVSLLDLGVIAAGKQYILPTVDG